MPDATYNVNHHATVGQLHALALRAKGAVDDIPTETWTFVLDDDSEVEKEVAAWTSDT